jgi:hypothetical protein
MIAHAGEEEALLIMSLQANSKVEITSKKITIVGCSVLVISKVLLLFSQVRGGQMDLRVKFRLKLLRVIILSCFSDRSSHHLDRFSLP